MEDIINLRAIIISTTNGIPLFTLKFDDNIDEIVLSGFIGAIRVLAEKSIEDSDEIYINSGDKLLYCFKKNYDGLELMICAWRNKVLPHENLREPAEYTLDKFVQYYGIKTLKNWNGQTEYFQDFQDKLQHIIDEYRKKVLASQQFKEEQKSKGIMALFKKLFSE